MHPGSFIIAKNIFRQHILLFVFLCAFVMFLFPHKAFAACGAGTEVSRGVCRVFLTSGTTWKVPNDWSNASNTVECIGGGGNDFNAGTSGAGPGGAGGGAYAKSVNLSLTAGSN